LPEFCSFQKFDKFRFRLIRALPAGRSGPGYPLQVLALCRTAPTPWPGCGLFTAIPNAKKEIGVTLSKGLLRRARRSAVRKGLCPPMLNPPNRHAEFISAPHTLSKRHGGRLPVPWVPKQVRDDKVGLSVRFLVRVVKYVADKVEQQNPLVIASTARQSRTMHCRSV
jgi:hypothetical protein